MPTHGALTKAGKVRQQTPKIEKTSKTKRKNPRVKNRWRYQCEFILKRERTASFDPREKRRERKRR